MFIYTPKSIGMRGRQGKVSKLVLGESSKGEVLRGESSSRIAPGKTGSSESH